ncbi:hypothetical protein DL95DRAFT_525322 [Leptodontidium sp. 2 PMI_412]|nr:hypothetical protein DL95DRAFT_525322 [Leptodontidium sp. 2 PMI_412]
MSSWKLDERTGQMVLGQYFSIVYGQTWKFNAAWTLKHVIVEDWLDAVSENSLHMPSPFYLDYLVVLEISSCTGNSRRTSLWELLESGTLQSYLSTVLNLNTCQDLEILIAYFQQSASFTEVWRSITSSAKTMFKGIARHLLGILRNTGVGSNGLLQAWDSTSTMRMDGRSLNPCWRNMSKDDLGCATFAIITDVCIDHPQGLGDLLNTADAKNGPKSRTFLKTRLCLNLPAAHYSENYVQDAFSGTENSAIDEGRSAGASFEQWRVANSREHGASPESHKSLEAVLDKIRRRHVFRKREQKSLAGLGPTNCNTISGFAVPTPTTRELPSSPSPTMNSHRSYERGFSTTSTDTTLLKSLDFKNGSGTTIGNLVLQTDPQGTYFQFGNSAERILCARWSEPSFGILTYVRQKRRDIDQRMVGWVHGKPRSILPWMINHVVDLEEPTRHATEYIRGGEFEAGKQLVGALIF